MGNSKIIAGEKLSNLNKLQKVGREYKIHNNISKSYYKLSESQRGSQGIACADVLANVGIGSSDVVEADENVVNANVVTNDNAHVNMNQVQMHHHHNNV